MYLDTTMQRNLSRGDYETLIASIPTVKERLTQSGALATMPNSTTSYLQDAIQRAQADTSLPFTIRKIFSSLPSSKQIDIDAISFALEPHPLRLFENALASTLMTSFEQLTLPSGAKHVEQIRYVLTLTTAALEHVLVHSRTQIEKDKVMRFFNSLPPCIRSFMYQSFRNKGYQHFISEEICEAFHKTPLAHLSALRNLRFFAQPPYDSPEHDTFFLLQLYKQNEQGNFSRVEKQEMLTVFNTCAAELLDMIDPLQEKSAVTATTLNTAVEAYCKNLSGVKDDKVISSFHEYRAAVVASSDCASFFETLIQDKAKILKIPMAYPERALEYFIFLKQRLGRKPEYANEKFLANAGTYFTGHAFQVILNKIPNSKEDIFSPWTDYVITKICQAAHVDKNEVLKKWDTIRKKDLEYKAKLQELVDLCKKSWELPSEFNPVEDKYNCVIPFADTNWGGEESKFCFYYNHERKSWEVGTFSSTNEYVDTINNVYGFEMLLHRPSLHEIDMRELCVGRLHLEKKLLVKISQFRTVLQDRAALQIGPASTVLQNLRSAKSFKELATKIAAAKSQAESPYLSQLEKIVQAKCAYEETLAKLLSSGTPPIVSAMQPLFAITFNLKKEVRDLLFSDLKQFIDSLI